MLFVLIMLEFWPLLGSQLSWIQNPADSLTAFMLTMDALLGRSNHRNQMIAASSVTP